MQAEDPEKRRLRQLAETAGSLAPSRIGAWTAPGHVAGGSWSDMPWLGRIAFVALFVALAALVVLLVVVAVRDGQAGAAAAVVGVVVFSVVVTAVARIRRRRT